MNDPSEFLTRFTDTTDKTTQLFAKRLQTATERFNEHVGEVRENLFDLQQKSALPADFFTQWTQYTTDFAQRWILYWDTLRQRGDNFIAHEQAGKPPVLHFDYARPHGRNRRHHSRPGATGGQIAISSPCPC